MARVINQNNEVVSTKNTSKNSNNKNNNNKAAISKTSLIVGIVLFLALITVAIVLVLVFTKKDKNSGYHIPTRLEQYVINYQKDTKKDMKIQILKGLETEYIKNFKGECYVIVYNFDWENDNKSNESETYKTIYNFDAALAGGTTYKETATVKTGFLDAVVNCGKDIKVFIIDYSSVEGTGSQDSKPYFETNTGERAEISGSPEFYHINFTNSNGEHENIDRLFPTPENNKGYYLYNIVRGETNRVIKLGDDQ